MENDILKIEEFKGIIYSCLRLDCKYCFLRDDPDCINRILRNSLKLINELGAKKKNTDKDVQKATLEAFEKYYKAKSYSDVWEFERAIKQFKVKEHLND